MHHLHGATRSQAPGHMAGWGRIYDAITAALFLGSESRFRTVTADLARLQPGESVLDVGCGTGTLTLLAKRRVGTGAVAGIDAAADMVAAAQRKAAREALAVDFQVGLIQALPFPDDSFDVVLSSLMLHHVPKALRPQGFLEIRRVLKPGGRLLVVDLHPPAGGPGRHLTQLLLGNRMMKIDLSEDVPGLEAAGFVHIETGPTAHWAASFLSARAGKVA